VTTARRQCYVKYFGDKNNFLLKSMLSEFFVRK
jgi:hypothetical protein